MDKYKISWKNVVINKNMEMYNEIELSVLLRQLERYAPCFLIIP